MKTAAEANPKVVGHIRYIFLAHVRKRVPKNRVLKQSPPLPASFEQAAVIFNLVLDKGNDTILGHDADKAVLRVRLVIVHGEAPGEGPVI